MRRIVSFLLLVVFLICGNIHAQTVLNRGDLAIVGVNAAVSGSRDEISFVCFKDIATGTEIQVTDNGYESCMAGLWSGGEGGAILKRTGAMIPKGTVITFRTAPFAFTYPDANWSISDLSTNQLSSAFNMNSTTGDQLYFAQGGTWVEQSSTCTITGPRTDPNAIFPGNAGRILFGFSTSGSWVSFAASSGQSGLYPGMQCFSMAPTAGEAFNKYTGPLTATTQTDWIKRISTAANWTTYSSSANYTSANPNFNVTNFVLPIVAGGDIPTATWTTPSALCASDASINLNSMVTGTTGGTWSGTGVSGSTFNPTGLNGNYNITYTINYTPSIITCPITQTNTIVVKATPAAPVLQVTNSCGSSTVTATGVTGTLTWSDGGTGNPRTVTSAATFTVTQTTNGCTSASSNSVTTAPATAPPAPVLQVTNSCGSSTLTATGVTGTLNWSDGGTGNPRTVTNAATFTVTQTVSGCTSASSNSVTTAPTAAPAAPMVTTPIGYCQNATATALVAMGANLLWYTAASGGSGTTIAPVPVTTTVGTVNYYVTQTVGGCESPRVLIAVNISAAPTINTVANQSVCKNSFTTAINFSGTGAAVYNWTNNTPSIGLAASGTGDIASFQALNAGTTPVIATITATPVSTAYAYVANYGTVLSPGNTVSIINTLTNTVTGSIPVGNNPFGVAVSPDGTRVYVTNYSPASNSVSVINTASNTVTGTIAVGSQPMGVAVSPDGTRVYVANQISNTVSVINTATNAVVATIPVSLQPQGITVSPDGTRVYVANVNSNNISVINTATNAVLSTIAVGVQPITVAISADGSRLYVPNYGTNNVSVINTATNAVIATVTAGTNPNGAATSPDGSKVYITNQAPLSTSSTVSIISTASNTVTATVPVGATPQGVSFTSDGTKAYVANAGSNNVSVINVATNTVTATVSVGNVPRSLGNFITPSNGCTGTPITFTITVTPSLSATYTYASSVYCATGTATPIITGTTGGTFSGSTGLVINSATGVIDLVASTPGSYSPKYDLTGCGNFTATANNITIYALPSVPVAAATSLSCAATTGTITVSSPLNVAYGYSIDGTTFQASPVFNNVAPGTYTVTVKDAGSQCTNTSAPVVVSGPSSPPANPVVTATQPTCTVPTGSITVTSPTGTGFTYSVDGTNYTNTSGTFTGLVPNTYNVTAKNAAGCVSGATSITITAAAAGFPAPVSSVTQPTCTVATGTITVTTPIGAGFSYSLDAGSFQTSPTFANLAANTSYQVNVKGSNGCITTATVAIDPVPVIAIPLFSITQPTCTVATGSITVTAPVGVAYTYSIDGVNFQSSTSFTNIAPNSYTLTVKNTSGCSNNANFTINAAPVVPAAPGATTPVTYCQGAVASVTPLVATGANLLWYTAITGGTGNSNAPTPSTASVGSTNYYVSQTVGGCESPRSTIVVDIIAAPATPVITASGPLQFCQGKDVILTSSSPTGNQWYKDGGLIAGAVAPSYTATESASYTVVVTNATNCSSTSLPTIVTVWPLPIVSAGPDILVLEGDSARLYGAASVGTVFTYQWFPGQYLSNDAIATPWVVSPLTDMYYILEATNENGCSNTDMVFVKVLRELIIPNVFSPNGDGTNDTWVIPKLSDYAGCTVEVFNRYGQLIFRSIGYNTPWDGTYNGKPLPVGTYYYIINPKNGRKPKSGPITILR